ncbi:RNA polymerase sigma factor [Hymenobacter cellulosilyticus]|uniref:Sigma-70 family RNA polymerase sigma factor n=1 Tax=Hymenobacter cellulosilyticus TaxID=2932248 RepID=A0A8T9QCK6_9BACT|nr:sigma-70 family RNA polymerase sigma factor [Hymenobacter cellulosilyticus]UOQ74111.1 sigma-70 family RNA polymerase sigma factor [Hymenobacter cellulosilyticus]
MPVSDHELVQRLTNREARAMTVFYQQFGRALHGTVLRVVGNPQSAEDVLQESLLKVWVSIASYDAAKSQLFTWAAAICRNAAIDHLRSARYHLIKRMATLEDTTGRQFIAPTEFNPEHIGVPELLLGLRPEYRQVLDLLYLRGYTQAEAAEELRVPLGTVKTWSMGARQRLSRLAL